MLHPQFGEYSPPRATNHPKFRTKGSSPHQGKPRTEDKNQTTPRSYRPPRILPPPTWSRSPSSRRPLISLTIPSIRPPLFTFARPFPRWPTRGARFLDIDPPPLQPQLLIKQKRPTLFNKLRFYAIPSRPRLLYSELFKKVNKHCSRKHNQWMANLRHHYFNTPWALISFFAAVALLTLTLIQTVYTVLSYYKKDKWCIKHCIWSY